MKYFDRVKETATTTGTGDFTLAGAVTGFRTFASVLSINDTCYYCIALQGGSEWEVGLGTYSAANTLTRTTVLSGSNSGSAVNFSAGTKDVFLTVAAYDFHRPSFSANKNAVNQTGIAAATPTKVTFGTEEWDTHGYYDASTSRFTPLIPGVYSVKYSACVGDTSGDFAVQVRKNGTTFRDSMYYPRLGVYEPRTIIVDVYLNGSTDYIEAFISCAGGGKVIGDITRSFFQATRVA